MSDHRNTLRRAILGLGGFLLLLAMAIFLPAGIGWWQGWTFWAVFASQMAMAALYLWRTNPEIFVARSKVHAGTKGWDKVMLLILVLSFVAIFLVAGLDAKFHWSSVPLWLIVLGYVLLSIGMAGSVWVYGVNKFAEPGVRIQTDRGHKVVDTGPYAIVRHPLYVASFFVVGGIALALASFWRWFQSQSAHRFSSCGRPWRISDASRGIGRVQRVCWSGPIPSDAWRVVTSAQVPKYQQPSAKVVTVIHAQSVSAFHLAVLKLKLVVRKTMARKLKPKVRWPDITTSPESWTIAEVRGVCINPVTISDEDWVLVLTGIPPFEAAVDEATWISAGVRMVGEVGPAQYLVNVLYQLKKSMRAVS